MSNKYPYPLPDHAVEYLRMRQRQGAKVLMVNLPAQQPHDGKPKPQDAEETKENQ